MQALDSCGLYIHIPFCKRRCSYCSFVSYPFESSAVGQYIEAVIRELTLWSITRGEPEFSISTVKFDSIYFGGGTPSLLEVSQIERLLDACFSGLLIAPSPEITIEVNPDSCTFEWLRAIFDLGVNRVSLGVQSFNDAELRALGRSHDTFSVLRTYADMRAAGFKNASIDLMAGFPGHTVSSFEDSLRASSKLSPEHISVYLFELKEGSAINRRIMDREETPLDDDLSAELYEVCCDYLTAEGYRQYEISNFSKEGFDCRHNLKYWTDTDYLALGAGAHGLLGEWRYENFCLLNDYLGRISRGELALKRMIRMSPFDRFRDALIMGARLVRGVDLESLAERYQVDAPGFVNASVADLKDQGLFELKDGIFRFTPKGRLLSNQVFSRWV